MNLPAFVGWIGLSILKFVATPSAMIYAGNDFLHTWFTTSLGAAIGFVFFYYLGNPIFSYFKKRRKKAVKITAKKIKRLRFIKKNGVGGLLAISVIASVPITGIMAARFFGNKNSTIFIFILGFTAWSLILTTASYLIKTAV